MKRLDAWPLYVGLTVAGAAAVVASATTLADLATSAGWTGLTPWLLPASLDVGSAVGVWSWLRPGVPEGARSFARTLAIVGSSGTLVGNAVGHLIASSFLGSSPLLVIAVGAAPAAMLVALAHLAALLVVQSTPTTDPIGSTPQNQPAQPAPAPKPGPAEMSSPPRSSAGPVTNPIGSPDPIAAAARPDLPPPVRQIGSGPTPDRTRPAQHQSDRVKGTDSELRSALERAIKVGRIDRPLTEASVLSVVVAGGTRARQLRDEINKQDQDATDGDNEPERVSG